MDRVDALRAFAHVADLTSFTRAATALGLPKATVSVAIRQLEDSIGVRLFHRTTRVVRLTEEGALLYARCRDVVADFDELAGLFRTTPEEPSGRVRIDMPSSMAGAFFIPRLLRFLAAHPRVQVDLTSLDRPVDPADPIDLFVRMGEKSESTLTERLVGHVPWVNAASAAYLRRHGAPRTPAELAQGHLVVGYASSGAPVPASFGWMEGGLPRTMPARCRVTVDRPESYVEACLAGVGIIQAPRYSLQPHFARGALLEILPDHRSAPLPLAVLHRRGRPLSRRAQALLDILEPEMKSALCT